MALISGTARGQGRAAALRFAAEGALVVGGDLLHEEAIETLRLITREGGSALAPGPLDVADEDFVHAWVAEAADASVGVCIAYAHAGAVPLGTNDSRPCKNFTSTMRAELDSMGLTGSLANRRTALPQALDVLEQGAPPSRPKAR
ncbi:SDR family oxidoreductase [Streptomyces atroolivaceus]|uniref:SDR family oxidoreductase n=1 Tax=Streptomyces atroolivaceus TaxID=66869 RepID=UPI0037B8A966